MSLDLLFELAWKSLPIAALALCLPALLRKRSAAERSAIAHAGLAVLALLPVLVLFAPRWEVLALGSATAIVDVQALAVSEPIAAPLATPFAPLDDASTRVTQASWTAPAPIQERAFVMPWLWLYAVPALALAALLMLALLRLSAMRAESERVSDPAWRLALADAQRRMGYLEPIELRAAPGLESPLSWGLLRPIILIDSAVASTQPAAAQAEALLAHEVAHVLRHDWSHLLMARVVTAMYWFNPLVWQLAALCHRLREEAADDAVLSRDVPSTDYAQLLVSAARRRGHRLLAAHAMAPSQSALKLRVLRVLDAGRKRTPAVRSWTSTCAAVALSVAMPLAALAPATTPLPSLAPLAPLATAAPASARLGDGDITAISWLLRTAKDDAAGKVQLTLSYGTGNGESQHSHSLPLADLAGLDATQLAQPAATPVHFRLQREAGVLDCQGSARQDRGAGDCEFRADAAFADALERAQIGRPNTQQQLELAIQNVGLALVNELARQGYERPTIDRLIELGIHGASAEWLRALDQAVYRVDKIERLVEFRIHGVSPAFISALVALGYRDLPAARLVEFRIHGVTPEFVGELKALGYSDLPANRLVEFRIHGVSAKFVSELAALGYQKLEPARLVEFRIHGVSPEFVVELAQLGYRDLNPAKLVEMRIHDVSPEFIRSRQKGGTQIAVDELISQRVHGS
jgi:beta-lactamase regulating signal transducer with metallopeptidase domain